MSLTVKSNQNMEVAKKCRDTDCYFDTGVSRAYYSAFQQAKQYLIEHGVTESNYLSKAKVWNVTIEEDRKPFSHSSIWKMVKGYFRVSKSGEGLKIVSLGEELHRFRKIADYESDQISKECLVSCIKRAQGLKDAMAGVNHEPNLF